MTKVNIPDLRGSLKPECARDSSFQGLSTMACDCNSVCCAATTIRSLRSMYYTWVHENFMRGETFLRRDSNDKPIYPQGVGFQDPFHKGVRAKPLPDNTKVPLPQGPMWDSLLNKRPFK